MKYIYTTIFILILLLSFFSCEKKKILTEEESKNLLAEISRSNESVFETYLSLDEYYDELSDKYKAEFGFTLFRYFAGSYWTAEEMNKFQYEPVFYIDNSISYYKKQKSKSNLIQAYTYKGEMYESQRIYPESVKVFLEALDIAITENNPELLIPIYYNLSRLAGYQDEFEKAEEYCLKAIQECKRANRLDTLSKLYLVLGWIYNAVDKHEEALVYALQALPLAKDSITIGDLLNTIGRNYSYIKKKDSALYYLKESLNYPSIPQNMPVRCFHIADEFYIRGELDSAVYYVNQAFKYPMDIYFMEECFDLLREIAALKNDQDMVKYFRNQVHACQDSIKRLSNQSNINLIEQLHQLDKRTVQVTTHRSYLIIFIIIIFLLSGSIVLRLYRNHQSKKKEAETYKTELDEKSEIIGTHHEVLEKRYEMLLLDLSDELKRTKEKYAVKRAKANFEERQVIDKTIYNEVLHLDKEKAFITKMNHILNGLPEKLQTDYPDISFREIIWCCLFILQVSSNDMALILDYKQTSLYKFKQRLIKKLNFTSAKDLEQMLYDKMNE